MAPKNITTEKINGPLIGVNVVEFTSVVLGPLACQTLGDMGADVIKVEPPYGDSNRHIGLFKSDPDMATFFLSCNRNKKSIVLDLKTKRGLEAALKLCKDADVVVHNFRASAMEKLGLDYSSVRAVNENVIYCATYGFAADGPYGDIGAFDDTVQAASGLAHLMQLAQSSDPNMPTEPKFIPTILADKTTAGNVVQAVLAALFSRERTGQGQAIEVPMFESMVAFNMVEHLWGQSHEPPSGPMGYSRMLAKSRKPYPTKDGYLAVLPYWDVHWKQFCALAGTPELIVDPRFKTLRNRTKNIGIACDMIAKITKKKSTAEWLDILAPTKIPHMIMNTLDDLLDDPHLAQTGFWQIHEHASEGKVRMSSPPINFARTPASIRSVAPKLGEHSTEILQEIGYSNAEISEMLEDNVTKQG